MLETLQQAALTFLQQHYGQSYTVKFDQSLQMVKVYSDKFDRFIGKTTILLFEFCLKSGLCSKNREIKGVMFNISTSTLDYTKHAVKHSF